MTTTQEYKKQPNDFRVHLAMDTMVRLYKLSEKKQLELSGILSEGECADCDFDAIMDQDRRIRGVFGVSCDDDVESQIFDSNYGTALELAVGQARIQNC